MLTIFAIQIKHALTYSLAASHWLLVYPWNELIIFSRPQIYFVKLYLYVKIKQKNLSRTISIYINFFIIYFITLGLDLKRKKPSPRKSHFIGENLLVEFWFHLLCSLTDWELVRIWYFLSYFFIYNSIIKLTIICCSWR